MTIEKLQPGKELKEGAWTGLHISKARIPGIPPANRMGAQKWTYNDPKDNIPTAPIPPVVKPIEEP